MGKIRPGLRQVINVPSRKLTTSALMLGVRQSASQIHFDITNMFPAALQERMVGRYLAKYLQRFRKSGHLGRPLLFGCSLCKIACRFAQVCD